MKGKGDLIAMPLQDLGGDSVFEVFTVAKMVLEAKKGLGKYQVATGAELAADASKYTKSVEGLSAACGSISGLMQQDSAYLLGLASKELNPELKGFTSNDASICAAFSPCGDVKEYLYGFSGVVTNKVSTPAGDFTFKLASMAVGVRDPMTLKNAWREFDFDAPESTGKVQETAAALEYEMRGDLTLSYSRISNANEKAEITIGYSGASVLGLNFDKPRIALSIPAESPSFSVTIPATSTIDLSDLTNLESNIVWDVLEDGNRVTATASSQEAVAGLVPKVNFDMTAKLADIMAVDEATSASLAVAHEVGIIAVQLDVDGATLGSFFQRRYGVEGKHRVRIIQVTELGFKDETPAEGAKNVDNGPPNDFYIAIDDGNAQWLETCATDDDCDGHDCLEEGYCSTRPAFCTASSEDAVNGASDDDCPDGFTLSYYKDDSGSFPLCVAECEDNQVEGGIGKAADSKEDTTATKDDLKQCWKCENDEDVAWFDGEKAVCGWEGTIDAAAVAREASCGESMVEINGHCYPECYPGAKRIEGSDDMTCYWECFGTFGTSCSKGQVCASGEDCTGAPEDKADVKRVCPFE